MWFSSIEVVVVVVVVLVVVVMVAVGEEVQYCNRSIVQCVPMIWVVNLLKKISASLWTDSRRPWLHPVHPVCLPACDWLRQQREEVAIATVHRKSASSSAASSVWPHYVHTFLFQPCQASARPLQGKTNKQTKKTEWHLCTRAQSMLMKFPSVWHCELQKHNGKHTMDLLVVIFFYVVVLQD